MLNLERLTGPLSGAIVESPYFRPLEAYLNDDYREDSEDEVYDELPIEPNSVFVPSRTNPTKSERSVVALDSTSRVLGYTEDGVVGAIRAAIVSRSPQGKRKVELYGPYLICFTNQNKDDLYRSLQLSIFGKTPRNRAPHLESIVDRTRNLLEKLLQFELVTNYENSLLLFDGALTSGTLDSPKSFGDEIIHSAPKQGSDIASISKKTSLTLKRTEHGVRTVLEGLYGPAYVPIKRFISQNLDRYNLIEIYVGKLTPQGDPFRIDIPQKTILTHDRILSDLCGLAGDYGYVEELRLSHVNCILTPIETIEMQAAATVKYGLTLREDEMRKKLFGPYGRG